MDPISIGLGAASIGSGLIGGLLGRGDANKAARAQEEAARLQYQAAQDAIAEQRRQYDQGRQDLSPYRGAGQYGIGELLSGMESGQFAAPEFGFQDGGGRREGGCHASAWSAPGCQEVHDQW